MSIFRAILTVILLFGIGSPSLSTASSESVKTSRSERHRTLGSGKSPLERPIDELLSETTLRSAIDKHLLTALAKGKPAKLPNRCDEYIKDDGSYGRVGEIAKQALANETFKTMLTAFNQSDIAELCPNFSRMNPSQRTGFWIWTLAGIEWDETACGTV